ncbi:Nudix hydrolase [Seminavis robusta]|uniref:Nudix hydrolase n=1 Tax=Seminavis robusta TaxID=568900 RepID=A0A9N8E1J0_9STRA|nr:Nudix hydrolase [Seminavis robusta]|eukprot:Sro413_g138030.1 Nudix hydrolase (341) ;mRNA; r:19984-21006
MNGSKHPTNLPGHEEEEREASTGTKLSPVCLDEDMKEQSTPTEELRNESFPKSFSLTESKLGMLPHSSSATSSAKNGSDAAELANSNPQSSNEAERTVLLKKLMEKSAAINSTVADRTISRHGRSNQRWIIESDSSEVVRLVTGCVPILKGGKIMLVSASKKKEWILPKGGWEKDEELEESAIRETFEEAGVMGVLGPKLAEIKYETRKSKKRRLESSSASEDEQVNRVSDHGDKGDASVQTQKSAELSLDKRNDAVDAGKDKSKDTGPGSTGPREAPKIYSHVCAKLFPLYIKEVMSTWPEKGRLRKAVDLDQAIELLVERPEMQSALLEVRARRLHLV